MIRKVLILGTLFFTYNVQAQTMEVPVANDDFFNATGDSALTVMAPGLFENDDLTEDSLQMVLVLPPSNGDLTVNIDGSFEYTADPDFDGVDSFTYLIQTLPMQVLEVDTSQSALNFDLTVAIQQFNDPGNDNADGRIGGQVVFFLTPNTSPFTEAHLYELDLVVVDPLSLSLQYGGLIKSWLDVDADSGSFQLNMSQRGGSTEVTDGLFTQTENKISVAGTVLLDGRGLLGIGGLIPDDPQVFDTETDADISIQLMHADTMLTVEVPVDLAESFELSGTNADLKVTGSLLASGKLQHPVQSNMATVSITVEPISRLDVDRELPFQYALSQNYPNPFNPVTTIAYSIPTAETVSLKVFDMLGREVATLVEGIQAPGIHELQFDAGNLPSGMYLYRLNTQGFSDMKKLILLK